MDVMFREDSTEQYYLSVQVGEKIIRYLVLDSTANRYIGYGEVKSPVARRTGAVEIELPFHQFIQKTISEIPLLQKRFGSVKVIWEGSRSTMVPEPLFMEKKQAEILAFNTRLDKEDKVFSDFLPGTHAYNIYSIPEKSDQVIRKLLHTEKILHLSGVLAESILHSYKGQLTRQKVFLNVRDTRFDIIIMDQHKLQFANMFEFRQPEDLVYFTLFVMEQTGLSTETTDVILMGKVMPKSALYNLIFKYLRKVEFARRNPAFQYGAVFRELSPHAMFPLINLYQCGL